MRKTKGTAKFDIEDFPLMINLVANLDAKRYESPRAKKLIYQCQDIKHRVQSGEIDWVEVV